MAARASAPRRTRPPRAGPPAEPSAAVRPRPPREPRGLPAVTLIASVLLHVVILLLFRFETPILSSRFAAPPVPSAEGVMRAVRIRPVETAPVAAAEPAPVVVRERPPVVRFPAAEAPPAAEPPAPEREAAPPPVPSAADRLSGRTTDPRLYAPPRDAGTDPDAIVRDRLADRLDAWNDSVAAGRDAAARARDWTVTDGSGRRWGISPGRIHLGSITIPLTTDPSRDIFQPPPDRRDEVNARLREWYEIQQQAARAEVRATFDARVKAIRERREAEREKAEGGRKSGGS